MSAQKMLAQLENQSFVDEILEKIGNIKSLISWLKSQVEEDAEAVNCWDSHPFCHYIKAIGVEFKANLSAKVSDRSLKVSLDGKKLFQLAPCADDDQEGMSLDTPGNWFPAFLKGSADFDKGNPVQCTQQCIELLEAIRLQALVDDLVRFNTLSKLYTRLAEAQKISDDDVKTRVQFKTRSLKFLPLAIAQKEAAIAAVIEKNMVVECAEWLAAARAKAEELGIRPSLEEGLGRVANLFSDTPNAKCYLYAEPYGNHREYKADFYWVWRQEGREDKLMNGGLILHVSKDSMYWGSHS